MVKTRSAVIVARLLVFLGSVRGRASVLAAGEVLMVENGRHLIVAQVVIPVIRKGRTVRRRSAYPNTAWSLLSAAQ